MESPADIVVSPAWEEVDTSRFVLVPDEKLHMNQILALEDVDGFTLGLGI